ncbi:FAD/NAD(P)-binding oxidoreductase [Pelagibius sp. CAU 1746]|uniref:NAD(P)/FAD-dependent oxidoreductase n=1 Tax=Pelagibius sp. CAU 1746 TaxID=3140370 RepID=UPI00325AE2A1
MRGDRKTLPQAVEVAVVGGGPAGLAAATRLKERGVASVAVLDREPRAGGIPRHCGHYPFGLREFHRLLRGPDYARRLVARAEKAGVEIYPQTTVTAIAPGPRLTLSTPEDLSELSARKVLLATGVRETSRAARFIGGQRPLGVVSTGALQSMVYLAGKRPFARPVILGSELVSFSAILTCRHAGIRPAAMIEAGERITARSFFQALPLLSGIPLHLGTELLAIHGKRRVEGVTLRGPGGAEQELACDGVIVTGAFTPEATLCRLGHLELDATDKGGSGGPVIDQFGRCSDPDFFAAGNLLRPVETAGWSWREGVAAGDVLADSLAGRLPPAERHLKIVADHPAIKLALPQRIALPFTEGALPPLQLRMTRAAAGRLEARDGDTVVWSKTLSALPERRVLLPLNEVARKVRGGTLSLSFSEVA